jgi:hypothetical protein
MSQLQHNAQPYSAPLTLRTRLHASNSSWWRQNAPQNKTESSYRISDGTLTTPRSRIPTVLHLKVELSNRCRISPHAPASCTLTHCVRASRFVACQLPPLLRTSPATLHESLSPCTPRVLLPNSVGVREIRPPLRQPSSTLHVDRRCADRMLYVVYALVKPSCTAVV